MTSLHSQVTSLYDRIQVESSLIRYRSDFPGLFFSVLKKVDQQIRFAKPNQQIRFLSKPNFASTHPRALTMEGTKIDPNLLENDKDTATCPACLLVLEKPSSACPEGHVFCRECLGAKLHPLS